MFSWTWTACSSCCAAPWILLPSAPPVPWWLRFWFLIQVDLHNIIRSSQRKRGWSRRQVPFPLRWRKAKEHCKCIHWWFYELLSSIGKTPRSIIDHNGTVMYVKSWKCYRWEFCTFTPHLLRHFHLTMQDEHVRRLQHFSEPCCLHYTSKGHGTLCPVNTVMEER